MKEELENVIALWDLIAIKNPDALQKLFDVHNKISHRTINDCDKCITAAFYRIKKHYHLKFENVPTTD